MRARCDPLVLHDRSARRRDRHHRVRTAYHRLQFGGRLELEAREQRLLRRDEVIERALRAAPHPHFVPGEDLVAGREHACSHVASADDRQNPGVLARHPLHRHRSGRPGTHHRVVAAVADRQRKAGFRVRVDQDREDGRQVELLAVALPDRHPLACGRLRLLDVRRHRLPLARILVQDDMAFRIHVEAPLAVHAVGLLDAGVVLPRGEQPRHLQRGSGSGSCGCASCPCLLLDGIRAATSSCAAGGARSRWRSRRTW